MPKNAATTLTVIDVYGAVTELIPNATVPLSLALGPAVAATGPDRLEAVDRRSPP